MFHSIFSTHSVLVLAQNHQLPVTEESAVTSVTLIVTVFPFKDDKTELEINFV